MMLIIIVLVGSLLYFSYAKDTNNREDELLRCYNCGQMLGQNYNYCPKCREKLKKECEGCGKVMDVR
jgi:predicted amidophosphoribosyltransferase